MSEVPGTTAPPNTPRRILRRPEVLSRTGLSKSSLYAKISEGGFPKPMKLGRRAVGWPEAEVDGWINARIASRE